MSMETKHEKYQRQYRECCMLLGNLSGEQISLILDLIKQLSK